MRVFQVFYLILFIGLYLFITYAAYKSTTRILRVSAYRNTIRIFITAITILMLSAFFILYIWPFNPRSANGYNYHLIFNAILSIDFVAKLPPALAYLAGLFLDARKKIVAYFMGLILSISITISMLYGALAGSRELHIKYINIEIKDLPHEFDKYRIVQISDLHLGSFINSKSLITNVHKHIATIDSDLILFTGDLVNNFSDETVAWKSTFQSMTLNHDCFSILGNHDYGNYTDWNDFREKTENFQKIVDAHHKFGFKILNNENVKIVRGNDSIYIAGVENWGHPPFPQYANLDKALSGIPTSSFIILLSHDPAHWNEVIKKRNDIRLTLSGHTHGLQWGISKAGFRFSLSYLSCGQWSGLYQFGDNYLNVNVGLGMVAIPWRINMPPEISVLTLKRIEID
jgi:predicted MPP superfamily phosphohydrolase